MKTHAATRERLEALVAGGQLGIFANGYWGHPAMKLPPEVNLLAVTHYLQALDVQRQANKIVSILGSKTPHIQNVAVGGVSNPIALNSQSVLSIERLLAVKEAIDHLKQFVMQVYTIDVAAVAAFYPEWTKIGRGVTNYLAAPDFPLDERGTRFVTAGGYIADGNLEGMKPITTFGDPLLRDSVAESVKHAWYQGGKGPLHPYKGETVAEYTDFQEGESTPSSSRRPSPASPRRWARSPASSSPPPPRTRPSSATSRASSASSRRSARSRCRSTGSTRRSGGTPRAR